MSLDYNVEATEKLGNDLILLILLSLLLTTTYGFSSAAYSYIIAALASAGANVCTSVFSTFALASCKLTLVKSSCITFANSIRRSLLFSGLATIGNILGKLIFAVACVIARQLGMMLFSGMLSVGFKPATLVSFVSVFDKTKEQIDMLVFSELGFARIAPVSLHLSASHLWRTVTTTIETLTETTSNMVRAIWLAVLLKTFSDWYTCTLDLETLLNTSQGLGYLAILVFGTTVTTMLNIITLLASDTACLVFAVCFYTFVLSNVYRKVTPAQEKVRARAMGDTTFRKPGDSLNEINVEEKYRRVLSSHLIHQLTMEKSLDSRNAELKKAQKSIRRLGETIPVWTTRCDELRSQILENNAANRRECQRLRAEISKRDAIIAEKTAQFRDMEAQKEVLEIEVQKKQKEASDNLVACVDHVDGERYDRCKDNLEAALRKFEEFSTLCKEGHENKTDAERAKNQALQKQAGKTKEEMLMLKEDAQKMKAYISELEAENVRLDPEIAY
ncbi:hypothetical protein K490DRAFT_61052 [Saccharata proteae CBS 121410]|uniref:Uncharacterized protein n=1 Tax=Saccharata proteae CBS 121410 TaxID=1314787 RepID=A0A9P4I183_9PEZI|nr:hypothetical protein K490DRAFT_61052 [Saccharata proteae CBS 121410]